MGEIVAKSEPNVSDTGRNGGEEPHMMMKKKNDQNHTVEIVLRTVGPARPSRLRVSSPIKVRPLPFLCIYIYVRVWFHFFLYLHD